MSLIPEVKWCTPDMVVSSDSCLSGGGSFAEGKFFKWKYTQEILNKQYAINELECLNVVLCAKLWGGTFQRKKIEMLCDNTTTVQCINSGSSKT